MLVITELSKRFGGVQALDRVSLAVGRGEVHGLLGQNGSGKSTLIKILGGYYEPDEGARVMIAGREVELPIRADQVGDLGIAIVHQNLGLVRSLTVLENMLIGRINRRAFELIQWRKEHSRLAALFKRFEADIDPGATVGMLRPVQQAQIAIVRAFDAFERMPDEHPRILILDEPTPFLPPSDVAELFRLVRQVAATGASVIFVSHDIDEVLEITDAVTVFRDGRVVGTAPTSDKSKQDIIRMIVGRDVAINRYERGCESSTAPAITIDGFCARDIRSFNLALTSGEIVGLTGLVGAGHEKLLHYLYGSARCEAGTLCLSGRRLDLSQISPDQAIAAGIILIPGDRQRQGLIETLPITENICLPVLNSMARGWWVTPRLLEDQATKVVERYDVRPSRVRSNAGSLSGGNQQKVVIGKWFQTDPRLVLLEEPTQGVDVGARDQIYKILRSMADRGMSILCASSDHEQLAAICDRVLVFRQGAHVDSLVGEEVNKVEIARRTMAASA